MLSLYPAIFYREEDGQYSVVFPDLDHLSTCGEDYNKAMEMAIDCLAGYLYGLKTEGRDFPKATPINKVDIHCEDDEYDNYKDEDISVTMVTVDVDDYAQKHFAKSVNMEEHVELDYKCPKCGSENTVAVRLIEEEPVYTSHKHIVYSMYVFAVLFFLFFAIAAIVSGLSIWIAIIGAAFFVYLGKHIAAEDKQEFENILSTKPFWYHGYKCMRCGEYFYPERK